MQKFVPIKQMDVTYNGASSSGFHNQDFHDEITENISEILSSEIKNSQKSDKTIMKNPQETKNLGRKNNIIENQPIKYKMSGYLKKKRNKVGGWRKIWCILQDQLLLSFNSKEDCDKDLLSFKDILNIVPGTTIKPLDRLNFTIETTTNYCYTFKCSDRESCTNWITALVESLPLKYHGHKDLINSNGMLKYNSSMDNISLATDISKPKSLLESSVRGSASSFGKQIVRMSISCDSIHNYNYHKYKLPKIPIAEATAKILKRNGMDEKRSSAKHKNHQYNREQKNLQENLDKIERAKNFRLHDKHVSSSSSGFVNQSNEVSRINRMFDDSTKNIIFQNKIHNKLRESVSSDSNIFKKYSVKKSTDVDSDLINKENKLNSIEKLQNIKTRKTIVDEKNLSCKTNNNNTVENIEKDIRASFAGYEIDFNGFKNCKNIQRSVKNNRLLGTHNITGNKIESYFYGMNHTSGSDIESSLTSSIEEQVKKLNLTDDVQSEEFPNSASKINHLRQTRTVSSPTLQHDNRRDPMVALNENEISLSDLQKFCEKHKEENNEPFLSPDNFAAEYSEIVFPSSTSSNSLITKKQQSLINDTSSNSIALRNSDFILNSESFIGDDNIKSAAEPIYAVVNLKNKYEQRKHRKNNFDLELQGQIKNAIDTVDGSHVDDEITGGKPRPKSAMFISSGDYEEVLNFSTESLQNGDRTDASSESENIYEPINIPYDPQYPESPHRAHALWKYFSIDALIEMAKSRKTRHKSKLEHSISSPLSTSLTDTNHDQHSYSPFSVLRRKLGNHRKSIKLRMKKFYKRNNSFNNNNCPVPVIINERNAFSDDELDSQGASGSTGSATSESLKSINGTSGDKQFTQLFENFPRLSKPRLPICVDDHGISRNKLLLFSSKLNGFHRESRKSSIKRSGRKNKGYTP